MKNNERKPGESIKQWRARIKAQKKEQRIQEEIDRGELLDASIVVAPRFEATISQGTDDKKSRKNNHRVGQESVFGERKYRQNRSLARRAFNDLTDAVGLTSPPTFEDGYGRTLNAEVPLWESAQGQELKRMGETAKDAGELVATGLAFGNPLTAGEVMAPLITGSQAYWIGHGINDGAQRIDNIGEGVKNFVEDPSWQNAGAVAKEVPMLALDVAGALPVAKTVTTTAEQVAPAVKNATNAASNYLKKQYASYESAKIINSEVNQFPKQKWLLDQYNDHDFIFNEFSNPNSAVHVTPNPIVGKNVTEKASHVSGTSLIPGSAERSLVGNENMIWLWDGKPYRAQWNDQTFISIPKTNRMTQTRQNRAVGVPKIDLTAPTTKIITRNPITGGFERQIVVSPTQSSKGYYTFYERPSTYFKGATYAGTPGTYAGKEVPTWQLPRGQRNQPHNPTATERIYSVLGRDPNVPTKGVSDVYAFEQHQPLQSLYKFLQQHGVDTKNITLGDLDYLYAKRLHAIRSTSNNNYNLALPDGIEALPTEWHVLGYDPEGIVGSLHFNGRTRKTPYMSDKFWQQIKENSPGAHIRMVKNLTRPETTNYYNPEFGYETIVPNRPEVSGISQRMYDASIPVVQQTDNGLGLMSGEIYQQPFRSKAVLKHYPKKKLLSKDGQHWWPEGLDMHGEVYLLDTPSGRYTHIPTKSSLFFPSAIKNGQITTNVNHGSIFLENGGKL